MEGHVKEEEDTLYVSLDSICVNEIGRIGYRWEEVEGDYGEAAATLEAEFGKYSECPREEQLGEIWSTFMGGMNLYEMWVSYHKFQQKGTLEFLLEKSGCNRAYALNFGRQFERLRCVYQGVAAGGMLGSYSSTYSRAGILFLENEWRPETAAHLTVRSVKTPFIVSSIMQRLTGFGSQPYFQAVSSMIS